MTEYTDGQGVYRSNNIEAFRSFRNLVLHRAIRVRDRKPVAHTVKPSKDDRECHRNRGGQADRTRRRCTCPYIEESLRVDSYVTRKETSFVDGSTRHSWRFLLALALAGPRLLLLPLPSLDRRCDAFSCWIGSSFDLALFFLTRFVSKNELQWTLANVGPWEPFWSWSHIHTIPKHATPP